MVRYKISGKCLCEIFSIFCVFFFKVAVHIVWKFRKNSPFCMCIFQEFFMQDDRIFSLNFFNIATYMHADCKTRIQVRLAVTSLRRSQYHLQKQLTLAPEKINEWNLCTERVMKLKGKSLIWKPRSNRSNFCISNVNNSFLPIQCWNCKLDKSLI